MSTIETLQERLARTLNGAARAADRVLAAHVREEGHRFAFLLAGLVRASRLYALDNDALLQPSEELAQTLAGLAERLGVVQLVLVEDQVYLNDVRLRVRPSEQAVVDHLGAELGRHDVGGLSFHRPLPAEGLRSLAAAISSEARAERPAAALRAELAGLRVVETTGRWRFRIGGERAEAKRSYPEVLERAERVVADTLGRLSAGWTANPLRVRRVVIDLVECLGQAPERAALAPFAGASSGSERHLVSVCQLALLLGRALGLDEATLSDLGVAALLHDVGYLESEDPAGHALAGTRLLLRQRGWSEAKLRRLLAIAEHAGDHRETARSEPPSLFARILHIAEHYDLLVTARGDEVPLHSPASALERMWSGRGTRYDPTLLAVFVNELGCWPPGTLLELADGRLALVVAARPGSTGWANPSVSLLGADDDGPGSAKTPAAYPLDQLAREEPRRVLAPALVPEAARSESRALLAAVAAQGADARRDPRCDMLALARVPT